MRLQKEWEEIREERRLCIKRRHVLSAKALDIFKIETAKGRLLFAENLISCNKEEACQLELNRRWLESVVAAYGDIKVTWQGKSCLLGNGDKYI